MLQELGLHTRPPWLSVLQFLTAVITHIWRSSWLPKQGDNNKHPQSNNHRDNVVKAEASSGQPNPIKASRTHNELHKELLLAQRGVWR
ncbi:hypothetical protein FQN60_007075 [Etheostoma spectabile]|uniref:Uncharacterized protein n=1 Tax=Etheostoma spectabile TaxID=54343 RepID=A0A5J5CAT6_9PERO|nr:hypothetical protein FQN60_007075 [Etheostoma spectabile]